MGDFGEALKAARTFSKKKLRETSERTGLSVGYLSDIEQGRKGPPEIQVVRKLQEFLNITDDSLVKLAERERTRKPSQMLQSLSSRPMLQDLFFRLKDMPEEELENILKQFPEK